MFHALNQEEIGVITGMLLGQVAERLQERGINLTWTPAAVELLSRDGFDPKYGARPLRRVIQRTVEDTLSEELLAGRLRLGDSLQLDDDDGHITVRSLAAVKDE